MNGPIVQMIVDAVLSGCDGATIEYDSEDLGHTVIIETTVTTKEGAEIKAKLPFDAWMRAAQNTKPVVREPAPEVLCRGRVSGLSCMRPALAGEGLCQGCKQAHRDTQR